MILLHKHEYHEQKSVFILFQKNASQWLAFSFKICNNAPPICMTYTSHFRGFAKGWFPKEWFWRMFPGTTNGNEGTFGRSLALGCSLVPKTGARVHSDVPRYQTPERGHIRPKPPFYETTCCLFSTFVENPPWICMTYFCPCIGVRGHCKTPGLFQHNAYLSSSDAQVFVTFVAQTSLHRTILGMTMAITMLKNDWISNDGSEEFLSQMALQIGESSRGNTIRGNRTESL